MATILIAEDAAFMRRRIGDIVKRLGHRVVEAEDGQGAIDAYRSLRPDAVLLDVTMPVIDGLDALYAIIDYDPGARVAMVTAVGQQSVIMAAIKGGAKDFVVKPFTEERLGAALFKLLDEAAKVRP